MTDYTSTLIDELYNNTPRATFDLVAKRMDLAVRIDKGIKAKGWSQKQFAEAMLKKPSEISRWLSGTHNFTTDTLWQIEQVLDIPLLIRTEANTPTFDEMQRFITTEVSRALEKWKLSAY